MDKMYRPEVQGPKRPRPPVVKPTKPGARPAKPGVINKPAFDKGAAKKAALAAFGNR